MPSSRSQRGLTLIEFMVSITIGLILVAGLTLLFANQSATQNELEKSSRQIENGRYAMQLLREDLQLAGYYGEFFNVASLTVPTTLPDPCVTAAATLAAAMPFAVQGFNAPGATLPATTCPLDPANHKPGTDILVVRRAETAELKTDPLTSLPTGLTPGQPYLQSGLDSTTKSTLTYVLGVATSNAVDLAVFNLVKKDGKVAPLRNYSVHVYYVSPCSVPANGSTCSAANTDDGGASVPTLKRLELTVDSSGITKFVTVPLVEGIENLQIDYGFDTTGDGSPDNTYLADATAVADWANLTAVRVYLLARNNERSPGFIDNKTYDLGTAGVTTATSDAFKRHVFTEMMRLVNPSARRDQ